MKKIVVLGLIVILIVFGLIGCGGDETYTVTFNSNGGSNVQKISGIKSGDTISLPVNPTKENNDFSGWFIDDVIFKNEFTSETVITKNLTVYAKWIQKITDCEGCDDEDCPNCENPIKRGLDLPARFEGSVTIQFPHGTDAEVVSAALEKLNAAMEANTLSGEDLEQFNEVLARGLKINVDTGESTYNFFTVIDWNTVSCHTSYLSERGAGSIIDNLSGRIINTMHVMDAPVASKMQIKDVIHTAKAKQSRAVQIAKDIKAKKAESDRLTAWKIKEKILI
jgi:uncharacterized repeat protein (TIGR02543 family)